MLVVVLVAVGAILAGLVGAVVLVLRRLSQVGLAPGRPAGPAASRLASGAAPDADRGSAPGREEELGRRERELLARERELAEREGRLGAEQRQLEERGRELSDSVRELSDRTSALERHERDSRSAADDAERLRRQQIEDAERRARELLEEAQRTARGLEQAAEEERRRLLEQVESERVALLERTAQISAEQARQELLRSIESSAKRDAAILVRELETQAREEGERRARDIVTSAVQRVASEQTTESVVSVLHLPAEDMKGRIIGREGRNIRSFEAVTGVNVIIDDTPEAVLLSCFDPVRREVGRLTLEALVLDGRIHPARIEETYEKSKLEVEQLCLRAAQDALLEVGITDLDEQLIPYLGRLRYRTSFGQNVLRHLVETAHIAAGMAAELGLPVATVKRCAFLHDIGKALTHEVEGSHALLGAELARRFGESEVVAHAIEAHHNEVAPQSPEALITQASDSCSGGRPGARREALESYVQRLERIEQIALGRPGVEKVFAMQAGREVRVLVQPDHVDDIGAQVLAREIAKQIEDELTYPGQIRVTVVRESRASELAR